MEKEYKELYKKNEEKDQMLKDLQKQMNSIEPNKNITRGELAKIIFTAFQKKYTPGQKIYNDLQENHWAYKFLMDASE